MAVDVAHPIALRPGNGAEGMFAENGLLASLGVDDVRLLASELECVQLARGKVLVHPGEEVSHTFFPLEGTLVSLLVQLQDGRAVEAALVGREGAVGGIVSGGRRPAFARGEVQATGRALRISCERLQAAKDMSAPIADLFARYADCLVAQLLQSAACNATHSMAQRLARWLLLTRQRTGRDELQLTQESLAEMLGTHRATVNRVTRPLLEAGLIRWGRGRIAILDSAGLEQVACECHAVVEEHFRRMLGRADQG